MSWWMRERHKEARETVTDMIGENHKTEATIFSEALDEIERLERVIADLKIGGHCRFTKDCPVHRP